MNEQVLLDIIKENKGLICSIIKKYTNYYEFDDLYQVSTIGIIKAFNNYDATNGVKFTTYAYKYILSEVINFVNNSRIIKTSREYNKIYKKILEARNVLTQKNMKEPSTHELSLFLELDEKIINNVLITKETVASLDAVINYDDKALSLLESITEEKYINNEDKIILTDILNKLDKKEQELINLRYFQNKTQSETAKYLHTNQVQVSRNEAKILKKIKKTMCNTL
ncbi:MAG: sigma-70 family RNA polymerase sigma factor [Bacilli bacterium]|nr:sigma-70 family RNA polymerase sigma factor [Bacilli bacterium]